MFNSTMLEVAIGIFFIYLFLSLICSSLQEWIAQVLALRAKTLKRGLERLLSEPPGGDLVNKLYAHPLIKGLGWNKGKPSYVSAKVFATSLLDVVAAGKVTVQDVRDAVAGITNADVRKALLPLIDEAGNDIKKTRENIEGWFNDAMERVSGWYKRRVQYIILVIAFVVSAALNVDTIMFANTLFHDAALRASLVSAVERATETRVDELSEEVLSEVPDFELPLGWPLEKQQDQRRLPTSTSGWVSKIVGILITTFAVSLGAPFWFGLLNRLVNIRAVGKTPAKQNGG